MGRAKHFADADELMFYFDEYLVECKQKNEYPNLAGFAHKCYCAKQTLLDYKEATHTFSDAMKLIYTFLENVTINNGMSDTFKKFYMTNTFKEYKDKQEIQSDNTNNNNNTNVTLTAEDQEKYRNEMMKKLKMIPDTKQE